jgi:hypothetical protein
MRFWKIFESLLDQETNGWVLEAAMVACATTPLKIDVASLSLFIYVMTDFGIPMYASYFAPGP